MTVFLTINTEFSSHACISEDRVRAQQGKGCPRQQWLPSALGVAKSQQKQPIAMDIEFLIRNPSVLPARLEQEPLSEEGRRSRGFLDRSAGGSTHGLVGSGGRLALTVSLILRPPFQWLSTAEGWSSRDPDFCSAVINGLSVAIPVKEATAELPRCRVTLSLSHCAACGANGEAGPKLL